MDAWNPRQYDKYKTERSQPFFDLANLLAETSGPEVVDLGCGTGELTSELHRLLNAKSTLGLDSSEKMLESARVHEHGALHFRKGDIAAWQAPGRYDVVFSNAALQWCPGHQELFARLKGSLRPGGQIAVQMPMNHDYPTHLLATAMSREEPWNSLLNGETYDKSQHILRAEDYAALLFRLGFKDQKVLLRVYAHQMESRDDVIEWVKGSLLTYFRKRLSKEDNERFLADYRSRLFQQLPDETPFFYPFKRILIWGRL